MDVITTLLSLVFSTNLVMSGIKWLRTKSESTFSLRVALTVCSIIGVVATATLTGNPVDFNQITDTGGALIEAIIVAVAAHFTYKAIKTT